MATNVFNVSRSVTNKELGPINYMPTTMKVLWVDRQMVDKYDFGNMVNLNKIYVIVYGKEEKMKWRDLKNLRYEV